MPSIWSGCEGSAKESCAGNNVYDRVFIRSRETNRE